MMQDDIVANAVNMGYSDVEHARQVLVPQALAEWPEAVDVLEEAGTALGSAGHGRTPIQRRSPSRFRAEGGRLAAASTEAQLDESY